MGTVTEDRLQNTWREMEYHLDILRDTKGTHVEICRRKWSKIKLVRLIYVTEKKITLLCQTAVL